MKQFSAAYSHLTQGPRILHINKQYTGVGATALCVGESLQSNACAVMVKLEATVVAGVGVGV